MWGAKKMKRGINQLNNVELRAVMNYMLNWNKCNGLPKVSSWHVSDSKKTLIMTFDNGEVQNVKMSKVFETVKKEGK